LSIRRIILFTLFLNFWSANLLAQNPHPYFRNFTTEHGLPSSEIHYTLEDDQGYMWFATDNGVSRFDGYSFKNFGPQEGLKHHVAFFLQKDPDGVIWIATMNGHLYYVKGENILPFEHNDIIEQYGQNGNVLYDFHIDYSTRSKSIAILGAGVLIFPKDGKFRYLKTSSSSTYSLLKDAQWLTDKNLTEFILRTPKLINNSKIYVDPILMIVDSVHTKEGEKEARLIASNLGHLDFEDSKNILFYREYLFKHDGDSLNFEKLSDFKIYVKSILKTENGSLLIGAQNGQGLKKFESAAKFLKNDFEQFLLGKTITHIFKDSKDAYWISTLEHGVFYTSNFKQKIFDTSFGLSSDHVSALAFKNENQVYIGLRDGNLFLLDIPSNRLSDLEYEYDGQQIIFDLLYDEKRSELWVTNSSFSYLDKGRWKNLEYRNALTNRRAILINRKMNIQKNSNLLWGITSRYFSAIDLEEKKKKVFSLEIGIKERVFAVKESLDNRVWIGTGRGLFEFRNEELIAPTTLHNAFESRIEDIGELPDTTLVVATKGEGVFLWKDNYFKQFTKANGLSSDMIENVHVDASGTIWVGTLEGLSKISIVDSGFQVKSYTMWHGLPSNEITQVRSYGDQVWICTTKGLMQWVEPLSLESIDKPIIEKIVVNDHVINWENDHTFSSQSNNFQINFLSINYRMPGDIPYRFRLNKDSWNSTLNRSANFTNLVPDNYLFEVQSQTENGTWSPAAQYNFTIEPPWWTSWWFRGILLLSIGGFAYRWYDNRTKRFQKENELLQEINQLERKALQAQMNPHFIFNSLNSIQYAILQKNNDHAVTYISKFAAFTRWVLKSSVDGKVLLEEEIQFLENYLSLEKLRFKNEFDYHFQIDENLSPSNIYILPLMIQPIVENAIKHGMKGKAGTGRIRLIFADVGESISIKIIDNGNGISKTENESRIYQPMGMSITKRRLEVAGEEVPMNFKTLKDSQGNITGTEVGFFLKKI